MDRVNEALMVANSRRQYHVPYGYNDVLAEMDRLLVRDSHPLAFEPGTAQSRFALLVQSNHRFSA